MIAMSLNVGDGPHPYQTSKTNGRAHRGNVVDVVSFTAAVALLNKHDCIKQTHDFFCNNIGFWSAR